MSLRLGLVQINVTDRAKAKDFYVSKLGLPCREPHGSEGPLEVDLSDSSTLLIYGVDKLGPAAYDTQRVTLVLYCDNLKKQIADWTEKGVEFVKIPWATDPSGIAGCPYGDVIAFKDPFGNTWELLQPHERTKPATVAGKKAKK